MAIRVGFDSIDEGTIVYELGRFSGYLDLLEPHIQKSRQEWEEDIEEQASRIDDPVEKDDFYDWHSDTNWDFEEYQAILCNYLLVTVYGYMEARLGRLCERVRRKRKLRISWRDLNGFGRLEQTVKYLELVGEIESPKQAKDWETMQKYGQLRNRIVHEGASISKDNKAWKFAKEKDLLVRGGAHPDDLIKLSPEFCKEILQVTKMFLLHIHRKVRQGLYPASV